MNYAARGLRGFDQTIDKSEYIMGNTPLSPDSLFQPFSLGSLTLANRIVMAPMTRAQSPGNIPNEKVVEYYRKRAAGGTGLIITEGTCVDHVASSGDPDVPFFYGEALEGWKKVVDAVHAEGGKIIPQLWHVGGIRRPGAAPDPEVPGYSPSGKAKPGKTTGHTMTPDDIQDVIDAFAKGAKNAEAIGFDGIEIHGAHGYLIDQFFWDGTNEREDEFGGDMPGRIRFAAEIVKAVRAAVSPDFPIVFRWSQWKQQDYSARLVDTPEQLQAFLSVLVDAGVDIFHCSTRRYWEPEFEGSDLNLAGWVKKLSGKPTITVGSVGLTTDFLPPVGSQDFQEAEVADVANLIERFDRGEFDLVAVGRAFIANPDWPQLLKENRLKDARPYDNKLLHKLV